MDELIDAIVADIYKKENVRGHLKPDQIALSKQRAKEYLERTLKDAQARIERHLRVLNDLAMVGYLDKEEVLRVLLEL